MTMLKLILLASVLMWYIIDRFKPLWADVKNGKYITIAVSAVFAAVLCFGLRLDLLDALNAGAEGPWWLGVVLTMLILMSGSSAVAELLDKIKHTNN